ncbi:hypothetical protein BH09BAC5_BH09BAC5_13050 [soil metagenome]
MKRKVIYSLIGIPILILCGSLSAQVTVGSITPMLIGSTGNYSSNGGYTLSSSTGEPIVPTTANGNYILTQGFQQPSANGAIALNANLVFTNSSCLGANDGFANVTPVGGAGPYSYIWSNDFGDSISSTDSLSPGTYTVTVIDAGGLTITQTFSVTDGTGICGIQPYSGITPNGDGHNDLWIIDYLELHLPNTVTIYNRWGTIVWKGENYDNSTVVWNGSNMNGSPLTDGTYFYVIEADGAHMESWVELSH